jgi:hypothetical protein
MPRCTDVLRKYVKECGRSKASGVAFEPMPYCACLMNSRLFSLPVQYQPRRAERSVRATDDKLRSRCRIGITLRALIIMKPVLVGRWWRLRWSLPADEDSFCPKLLSGQASIGLRSVNSGQKYRPRPAALPKFSEKSVS